MVSYRDRAAVPDRQRRRAVQDRGGVHRSTRKATPGGLNFGSPGAGSAPHLTAELLLRATGSTGVVVQFHGDAPAYTDLLAGRIDATLTAISTAIPHIQAGKLRVLAVANEERTPLHPETPTFREAGLPHASWATAGTACWCPPARRRPWCNGCNTETNAVLADADVRKKAEAVGPAAARRHAGASSLPSSTARRASGRR